MPPRHPMPSFGRAEQERLLRILGEARRELILAGESMERKSVSRGATETIVKNIDELALFLTGKTDYLCPEATLTKRVRSAENRLAHLNACGFPLS